MTLKNKTKTRNLQQIKQLLQEKKTILQQKKKPKSTLTFVDVFSGCGGITKGFALAGLQGIAAVDNNKEAV